MSGLGFSWARTNDGRVRILRGHRLVTTLAVAAAARFVNRVEDADPAAAQQLMARATGNYKRGNEPRPGG